MMERHDHINPWADKLQDIALPGENGSWEAMEALLDREMPVGRGAVAGRVWKDRRRWVLLIILLLLLIGVCNCPGVRLVGHKEVTGRKEGLARADTAGDNTPVDNVPGDKNEISGRRKEYPAGKDSAVTGRMEGGLLKKDGPEVKRGPGVEEKPGVVREGADVVRGKPDVGDGKPDGVSGKTDVVSRKPDVVEGKPEIVNGRPDGVKGKPDVVRGKPGRNHDDPSMRDKLTGSGEKPVRSKGSRTTRVGNHPAGGGETTKGAGHDTVRGAGEHVAESAGEHVARGAGHAIAKGDEHTGRGAGDDTVKGAGEHAARGNDTASSKGKGPKKKDVLKAVRGNDSTTATNKTSKPDSILQVRGWLAGAGLNQFFTVGGQQKSDYNSSGTTGGLSDYIPVPMVRYYFSRKLFVQIEAQFNTPQYTTKNLLASQSKPDSFAAPGRVFQTSLYIQKLFYFNLPVSIHYSPIRNLYVGAGIQYARLTNGVALYQDIGRSIFVGGRDSLASSKVQSFKNDTTYQKLKTNEFRLLLDIDYNFKRFIIGVRYNRALSNFINLPISNTQVTQSRNSSFQVYLRYIIWDGRKKALLPK